MSIFYIKDQEYSEHQIKVLSQSDFLLKNIRTMPRHLFKYYPNKPKYPDSGNINYSIEALENNTVYVQTPNKFDDPYDCNLYVENQEFALGRIRYWAQLCGIKFELDWDYSKIAYELSIYIYRHLVSGNPIETIFRTEDDSGIIKLHKEYFLNVLELELRSSSANENSYANAFSKVIYRDYVDLCKTINNFRIACFVQSPYSMLMWSHYANNHEGFCIEYEIPAYSDEHSDIFNNLYPVIYTDTRTNLVDLCLNWQARGEMNLDQLWGFYKYALLSKSLDWKYQQEWRLISYDHFLSDDTYHCKFFKISRVYLGNRMQPRERKQIIEICKKKNIPYVGMIIAYDWFEMIECPMLCEKCDRLKS